MFCCFDFVSVCLDLGLVGFCDFGSLVWVKFGDLLVSAGFCGLVGRTRISWALVLFGFPLRVVCF